MNSAQQSGPPGSHPHADRPNWRPATTFEEYWRNCQEGLEQYSERRAAKILGWSRVRVWRAKQMAQIPDDLLDRLRKLKPPPSSRDLAKVGQFLSGESKIGEAETCPHCGEIVRVRRNISQAVASVVLQWITEKEGCEVT